MTSQFRDESTFSSEVRTYWSHSQKTPTCQKSASCAWQFLQSIRCRDTYIYIHINRVLIVRIDVLNPYTKIHPCIIYSFSELLNEFEIDIEFENFT